MMNRKAVSLCSLLLCFILCWQQQLSAQSRNSHLVEVVVIPNKASWTYHVNEDIGFQVMVLKNQIPQQNVELKYRIGLEKMEPQQSGSLKLTQDKASLGKTSRLQQPGFLRCEAFVTIEGVEYRGFATAAVQPEAIQPTQKLPADFKSFWEGELHKARLTPLNSKMTLLPERSTATVDVYHISFANGGPQDLIYGMLAMPKKSGKYPAVLHVPGAGIRPYEGLVAVAEQGAITLQIGIHGIPVNLPAEVYHNLSGAALRGYPTINLDNKDQYYFKRVYLGAVRAVDFIHSLPAFDQEKLLVWGGSQGGALAIITAALEPRVTGLISLYPALSDLTGYLHQRAGGWPHLFTKGNAATTASPEKINTSAYYDVVNFARYVQVPGFYSWGYNDETCPPTSYYAAYNQIQAPKELYLIPETGHWTYGAQAAKIQEWAIQYLKK